MELTQDQDNAAQAIQRWIDCGEEQEFRLAGYAGTGKTTLVQHILDSIDEDPFLACPTGKAAQVLEEKTGREVSTVHSLLYATVMTSAERKLDGLLEELEQAPTNNDLLDAIAALRRTIEKEGPAFTPKSSVDISPGDLLVVDEASMVDDQMHQDILRTGARVLFVGDEGQLPPVKAQGFFESNRPHVALDQIVRQALDSPIIRASMDIRQGAIPDFMGHGDGEAFVRCPKSKFDHELYLQADQIITGKNATRRSINQWMRKRLGHTPSPNPTERYHWMPAAGERLICLKNQRWHDPQFVNGVMCSALGDAKWDDDRMEYTISLVYEGEAVHDVSMYPYFLQIIYDSEAEPAPFNERRNLCELDYGYAITAHKAQGSEWDHVILADDELMINQEDIRRRWLYTAITRAKQRLVWVY